MPGRKQRRHFPSFPRIECSGLLQVFESSIFGFTNSFSHRLCDIRCQTPEKLDREVAVGVLV